MLIKTISEHNISRENPIESYLVLFLPSLDALQIDSFKTSYIYIYNTYRENTILVKLLKPVKCPWLANMLDLDKRNLTCKGQNSERQCK